MKRISYIQKCFSKDPSIVSRKIADEFILVPIRRKAGDLDSIYTMNDVAGRIWELIDEKKRLEEIRDAIVEEFETTPEEAETDLLEFIEQLNKLGAVREV